MILTWDDLFSMMRTHEKQLENMNLSYLLQIQANIPKSYTQLVTQS